jgi:hypothetical protein
VTEADILLHVRDASNPESGEQRDDVLGVLASLGVDVSAATGGGTHGADAGANGARAPTCASPSRRSHHGQAHSSTGGDADSGAAHAPVYMEVLNKIDLVPQLQGGSAGAAARGATAGAAAAPAAVRRAGRYSAVWSDSEQDDEADDAESPGGTRALPYAEVAVSAVRGTGLRDLVALIDEQVQALRGHRTLTLAVRLPPGAVARAASGPDAEAADTADDASGRLRSRALRASRRADDFAAYSYILALAQAPGAAVEAGTGRGASGSVQVVRHSVTSDQAAAVLQVRLAPAEESKFRALFPRVAARMG